MRYIQAATAGCAAAAASTVTFATLPEDVFPN